MKKAFYNFALILSIILLAGVSTSCKENDDVVEEFADWQNTNDTFFNKLYATAKQKQESGDKTWKVIRNWSIPADTEFFVAGPEHHIVVEVLQEGTGSGCPLYTDYVRCHYLGRLLPSPSYPEGYLFDQSWYGSFNEATAVPATFQIINGGIIDGFSTALQNMHIGDKWRVYIPYKLGYGESGSSSIPGYSTLIFDITLSSYYRSDANINK